MLLYEPLIAFELREDEIAQLKREAGPRDPQLVAQEIVRNHLHRERLKAARRNRERIARERGTREEASNT